ncbi:MAG: phosphoglucosamine mutase [Terriglobia bacterium]
MNKLFGTDGIRGVAGEPPLDARTIFAVGRAVGEFLRDAEGASPDDRGPRRSGVGAGGKVLLGEDTRESSPWVTSYLAGGLRAGGVEAVSAGVLPTPGVAKLVRAKGFAAGLVVSASHNPYQDNGIKLIAATGMKFPDETEARLEERIRALLDDEVTAAAPAPPFAEASASRPRVDMGLAEEYAELLREATRAELRGDLSGLHLVVDCANGAAARIGPKLFRGLGAGVTAIHASPNGKNINEGCGALHPECVARTVSKIGADLGVAFDGDADRAIFSSGTGRIVNGDGVLLAAARWMKQKKRLKGQAVIGTVMANLGLERALRKEGLALVRTAVGDRYVLEEMQRRGANLGGEQSGHVIFLDDAPTGDGLLTALKMLAILRERGMSLDELVGDLKVFPQRLRNIRVREKIDFEQLPAVQQAIGEARAALAPASSGQGPRGRVVVRYSGTEPLARVMVEAETEAEVERWEEHIRQAIEAALGEE